MSKREEFAAAIKLAAWGYIFILFNINIGTLDLLPNWLGYIFLLVSAGKMANHIDGAKHLRVLAMILTASSAVDFVEQLFSFSILSGFYVVSIIISVVGLYFHFEFLTYTADIAEKFAPEKKKGIIISRNAYVILNCVTTVWVLFLGELVEEYVYSTFLLIIAQFCVMIYICRSLFSLAKALRENAEENEEIT